MRRSLSSHAPDQRSKGVQVQAGEGDQDGEEVGDLEMIEKREKSWRRMRFVRSSKS